MALPIIFGSISSATGANLDSNFNALGAIDTIYCTVSGTNTLTLTVGANNPTVGAYANGQRYSGIAAGTNSTAVTASVGGLSALNVYKDTGNGPTPLAGGEIANKNSITLIYDSALNSGAGGFHLVAAAQLPSQLTASIGTITSVAGTTVSAAILTGAGTGQGVFIRAGAAVGGFNDTTDTATNIVGAIAQAVAGTRFGVMILNTTGQTQTLVGGASVTITGVATTAAGATHSFLGVITNAGTPAVTIFG